jgi:hypothetical protein
LPAPAEITRALVATIYIETFSVIAEHARAA